MSKKIIIICAVALFAVASVAWAMPNREAAQLSTPGTERTLILPPAADHAPVISLGTAIDPGTGKVVEGYAFIHYKKEKGKPPHAGGPKDKGGNSSSTCYGFLAKGAKWKSVEPWVVNPLNIRGLSNSFVFDNLVSDVAKWEDAVGSDILGSGSITSSALLADTASPDNMNEVYFADVSDANAIAVTIVWGIFGGKPANRELVEWDQVYDDIDFDWSASGEADKMDFESIATHELGHSVGLDDLYELSCDQETMYGYAGEGEINKRDLEAGDIAGVNKLY